MLKSQFLLCLLSAMLALPAQAALISDGTWDGWTVFAAEDGSIDFGGGGQRFDAEYLLYKYDSERHILSLGLQSGFDILHGLQPHNGKFYWSGDLALSFDGNTSNYEYAVDFGLQACGFSQRTNADCGNENNDALNHYAGIYQVQEWNTDIHPNHGSSNPFAMQNGDKLIPLNEYHNRAGSAMAEGEKSYFRKVDIALYLLDIDKNFTVDSHWTMSSGNDAINGRVSVSAVPVPAAAWLFGSALIGLASISRRR